MSFSLKFRKDSKVKEMNSNTSELEVSSSSSASRSLLESSSVSSNVNDIDPIYNNNNNNNKSNSVISDNSLMEHDHHHHHAIKNHRSRNNSNSRSKSNVDSIDEQERKEEMVLMEMVRQTATLPWNGDEYEAHHMIDSVDELSINSNNKNTDLMEVIDTNTNHNYQYPYTECNNYNGSNPYEKDRKSNNAYYDDLYNVNDVVDDVGEDNDDDESESESITSPYCYFDHEFHYFSRFQRNYERDEHKNKNEFRQPWEEVEHQQHEEEEQDDFFAETHPRHRRKLTPQYKVMSMDDPEFIPLTPYEYTIITEEEEEEEEDDNNEENEKNMRNGSISKQKRHAGSKALLSSSSNEINKLNSQHRYNTDNCITKHKHKFVDKSSCSWISTRTTTTVLLPSASIRMLYNVDNINSNYYPNNYNNLNDGNSMHNNFFRVSSVNSESRNSLNNNNHQNGINISNSYSGNNLNKFVSESSKMPNTLREKVKSASLPPLCS